MSGTIKAQREQVAQILAATFPDLATYAVPPRAVTPPCAFVALGEAMTQGRRNYWEARLHVTLVAGAGDNEATVDWLERMTVEAASAISEQMLTPVTWDRPGSSVIAGNTYLAVELAVGISVEFNQEGG